MRGLYSEGLAYGGKFAFQNRLGQLVVGRKFTIFALFLLCIQGQIPSTSPPSALIFGGAILPKFFLHYSLGGLYLEGLVHGGAYFQNLTVIPLYSGS